MSDIAKLLSDNLKRLRAEKGWRQEDLAEHSRVSLSTIRGYEGMKRWPELPFLNAMAVALGVDASAFFFVAPSAAPMSNSMKSLLSVLTDLQEENEKLKSKEFSLEEQELLRMFRSMDRYERAEIIRSAKIMKDRDAILEAAKPKIPAKKESESS